MPLLVCKKCQRPFDTSLVKNSEPVCPYCGHDNATTHQNLHTTASPSMNVPKAQVPSHETLPNPTRSPCDWEQNWLSNPITAYINTTKTIFTDPVHSFTRIRPFESLMSLASYIYINCFIVMLGLFGMAILLKSAGDTFEFLSKIPEAEIAEPLFALKTGLFFLAGLVMVFFVPVIQTLVTLLVALILHLFLDFIAGSKKDYTSTLTVYGLSTAINWTFPLMLIPFVGPFLHVVVRLAYFVLIFIFGMGKMHEISSGRVFLAYLVPFLVCCCCLGALGVAVPVLFGTLAK